jgi:hypothetical protein
MRRNRDATHDVAILHPIRPGKPIRKSFHDKDLPKFMPV